MGHYARIACGSVIYGRYSQHCRESAASCGESVVFSRSDSRSGAGPADFAQPLSQNCPPKGGSTGFDRKMQMGFSSASILVPKSMGTEAGLGWVGPGWAALGWAGLGWAGRGGSGGRQRGQGPHVRKHRRAKKRIRACMHAHRPGWGGTDVARESVRNLGRPSRN